MRLCCVQETKVIPLTTKKRKRSKAESTGDDSAIGQQKDDSAIGQQNAAVEPFRVTNCFSEVRVTIGVGRNHVVRRMVAAADLPCMELHRSQVWFPFCLLG